MNVLPQYYKIVCGIGRSIYPLVAFDNALRCAGIGDFNIVKVSSILPANCRQKDVITLEKGSILYAAYSTVTIKDEDLRFAGVAFASSVSLDENGVIFECSSDDNPSLQLRSMCEEAMKNRNRQILDFVDCVQEVKGQKGLYTSAIAAIVLW